MNNQPCMVRPTIMNFGSDELHYYPFIIIMNKFNGSCDAVADPFGRICIRNGMEDVNPNVFNMMKEINESRTLLKKHVPCKCRSKFDGRKCKLRQKWNNDKSHYDCMKK